MDKEVPYIDLDADEGEPKPVFSREIIYVNLPEMTRRQFARVADIPFRLIIGISADGLIGIEEGTTWYGKKYKGAMNGDDMKNPELMQFDDRMQVFSWLENWDLLEWRKIGPEDSEPFATEKLAEYLRTTTEMSW